MDRLKALLPEYEQLESRVRLAHGTRDQLDGIIRQMLIDETNIGTAQVRILDDAMLKPTLVMTIAIYTAASLMGLVLGLLLIYLLSYYDRKVYTARQASRLMGSSVLTEVPSS